MLGALVGMHPPDAAAAPVRLDAHVGVVAAGPRVTGMGGAACAIAEGVEAEQINPAAVAARPAAFADDWFDWDFGVSALTTVGSDIDLDRSKIPSRDVSQTAEQAGVRLSFGAFAASVQLRNQSFQRTVVGDDDKQKGYVFQSQFGGIGLGWVFARGELVVGTVLGWGVATITDVGSDAAAHYGSAFAPRSFGVLWAPRDRRFRAGVGLQLPVRSTQELAEAYSGEKVERIGTLQAAESVVFGGSLTLGAAFQLLGHRGNHDVTFGEIAPARHVWAGPPVIVATDLVLYAPVDAASGVAGYLSGVHERAGARWSAGLRAGVESEVLRRRLRVRTGSYWEPTRYEGVGRLHWTGGADVRATLWLDWRVGVMWDLAPRYSNASFSFGLWH